MPFMTPRSCIASVLLTVVAATVADGQEGAPAPAAPSTTQGAPAAGGLAVPADYAIGPEDVLGVLFWREQEMSGDLTVRPDGKITLPLIGDIVAEGLTPAALKTQIQAAAAKYLTDANVTVVVRTLNSRKVFVTGEVSMPAAYALTGPRTVMQLLAVAGGLNEYADGSKITILRTVAGRTQSFKFNYKDVAKGKNLSQNILLQPGDTIVVP